MPRKPGNQEAFWIDPDKAPWSPDHDLLLIFEEALRTGNRPVLTHNDVRAIHEILWAVTALPQALGQGMGR